MRRICAEVHPKGFEPMLASGRRLVDDSGWAYDLKLDGWRSLVHVNGRRVSAYSRPGRDITASLPALAGLVDQVGDGTVLDGELVVGSGRASTFYRLGPLLASRPDRRRAAVAFVAFDVLAIEGERLTGAAYSERRRLLEGLQLEGAAWCTVPQRRDIGVDALLKVCEETDLEGLVAKRLTSPYRPGQRSPDWVKIKTPAWRMHHAAYRHRVV